MKDSFTLRHFTYLNWVYKPSAGLKCDLFVNANIVEHYITFKIIDTSIIEKANAKPFSKKGIKKCAHSKQINTQFIKRGNK